MAKIAPTGITEPAAGLLQPLKLALSYCTTPYAFPQELKDSIPLDGCIQNYDSAYHIIFTNVKTIQQSVSERAGVCHQWITLLHLGEIVGRRPWRHGCFMAGPGVEACLAGN